MAKRIKQKTEKGFTLAELLISSAIFVTVSGIILTALFSAFRLSKKSDTFLISRQNGDAAMTQMVRAIKYAKTLDDPISCVIPVSSANQITISSSSDGGQTTYTCPNDDSNTIASNGAALLNETAVTVYSCSFSCSQTYANSPPTITIAFTIGNVATGSAFSEGSSSVPFQTSVTMRNYTR